MLGKICNDHFLTRQWSDEEVFHFSERHCALRSILNFSGVTSQTECPHGWTRRDSSCYLFVTHVANDWTESEVRTVIIILVSKSIFFLLSVIFSFMFIHVNSAVNVCDVEKHALFIKKKIWDIQMLLAIELID